MSQPLKCLRTSSKNHSQLPSLVNSGTLSWVGQPVEYTTLIDHEGVREYLTKRESFIQPLSHWYKIVTVCLLFTIYFIIGSNKNSFPAFFALSKTYALNLTCTKRIKSVLSGTYFYQPITNPCYYLRELNHFG